MTSPVYLCRSRLSLLSMSHEFVGNNGSPSDEVCVPRGPVQPRAVHALAGDSRPYHPTASWHGATLPSGAQVGSLEPADQGH